MTKILEVNEDGSLLIPADLLGGVQSTNRYIAEVHGPKPAFAPGSPSNWEVKPRRVVASMERSRRANWA